MYTLPPGTAAGTLRGTLQMGGGIHAEVQTPRGQFSLACPGLTWEAAQNTAHSRGTVSALIPGGLGTSTAAAVEVDTRTGSVTGHRFEGTLRLPRVVQ